MARVEITFAADADTDLILEDLYAKAGKVTVRKYLASFKALYVRLAEFPDTGAPRPAIGADIRIAIVAPFVVIYKHIGAEDVVNILRVVHGRRRISGRLLGESR